MSLIGFLVCQGPGESESHVGPHMKQELQDVLLVNFGKLVRVMIPELAWLYLIIIFIKVGVYSYAQH